MQNAKDSFYIALRNRLAVINPARAVNIRAVQRPGVLVEDAEAPQAQVMNDVFTLRWTAMGVNTQLPAILAQMTCEIHYASSGSLPNGGLDRGRALSEMDEELLAMLTPTRTQKLNYMLTPTAAMQSTVFWSQPAFGMTDTIRDRLVRVAKVIVFAFQEQGD